MALGRGPPFEKNQNSKKIQDTFFEIFKCTLIHARFFETFQMRYRYVRSKYYLLSIFLYYYYAVSVLDFCFKKGEGSYD